MKADIWTSYTTMTKDDASGETTEKSTRKNFKNIEMDKVIGAVSDVIAQLPETASSFYIEISKSYDEKLEDALNNI